MLSMIKALVNLLFGVKIHFNSAISHFFIDSIADVRSGKQTKTFKHE